jgi:hypothetical protein
MGMIEFPAVPEGEPIRISASTFVAYRQCPDLAAARLEGEYGPDSVPAFRGGLAHRVFAKHLSDGPISEAEFNHVCRQEIGQSNLNHRISSLGLKPTELARTIDEVAALYRRFVRFPTDGFVGAEVGVSAEPADGVELVGSIDAVFEDDGGVRLVDWKTGGLGEAVVQLAFYALLWGLDRHQLPHAVEAVSVATGERLREVPTEAGLEETGRDVAGMIGDLRRAWASGDPVERRGGPWCRGCARLPGCSEGRATVQFLES